jgi:hypothetical protein
VERHSQLRRLRTFADLQIDKKDQDAELFVALDCPYASEHAIGLAGIVVLTVALFAIEVALDPLLLRLVPRALPDLAALSANQWVRTFTFAYGDRAGSQRYGLRRNADEIYSEIRSGRPS